MIKLNNNEWLDYDRLTDGINENHCLIFFIGGVLEQLEEALRKSPNFEQRVQIRKDAITKLRLVADAAYRHGWNDMRSIIENQMYQTIGKADFEFCRLQEWTKPLGQKDE